MAYDQKVITFRTPLNQGYPNLITQFNTFFAGNLTQVQSADFSRVQSTRGAGDLQLKVLYADVDIDGIEVEARLYQTNAASTAQAKFNAEFAAGLNRVPLIFIDLTDHEQNRTNYDQLMVIMAITDRGLGTGGDGLAGYEGAVMVAEPLAPIAAGATGLALIYDANGNLLDDSHPVTNVDPVGVWIAGERSLVVYDKVLGQYIGIPTCGGALMLKPAPAPLPGPIPVPCPSEEVIVNPPVFP